MLTGAMVCEHYIGEAHILSGGDPLTPRSRETLGILAALEREADQQGFKMVKNVLGSINTIWNAALRLPYPKPDIVQLPAGLLERPGIGIPECIGLSLLELGHKASSSLEAGVLYTGFIICRVMPRKELGEVVCEPDDPDVHDPVSAQLWLKGEVERYGLESMALTMSSVTALWMVAKYLNKLAARKRQSRPVETEELVPQRLHA